MQQPPRTDQERASDQQTTMEDATMQPQGDGGAAAGAAPASAVAASSSQVASAASAPPLPATTVAASGALVPSSAPVSGHRTRVAQPPPPPPAPWEPRSINVYKRESMTLIGEGTYGSVWLARSPSGVKVALKKIRKEKKEGFPITAIREIKLLKMLRHPNVVVLKDVVSSHMPGKEGDVFMCFEFCDHDLTGLLESKVNLTDAVVKYYIKSILEGLAYIHSRDCLHRDIKGANILVSNNGDVRIADLGLARATTKNGGYTNRVVTLWYRAPELLLGSSHYDSKIDTWSLGCLMAELLTRGTVLFPGNNTELDQLNKIYAACGTPSFVPPTSPSSPEARTYWPGVSELKYFTQFTPRPQKRVLKSMFSSVRSALAIDLLDKLLTLNPAERLSAEQALDHEYFFEDPLPIEPHQHPMFVGNHHEFGSKQRRRGGGGGGGGGGKQPNNASGRPTGAGPAPFDRMNVQSVPSMGTGGSFALNQPSAQGAYPPHGHAGQQGAYNNVAPPHHQQQQHHAAAYHNAASSSGYAQQGARGGQQQQQQRYH